MKTTMKLKQFAKHTSLAATGVLTGIFSRVTLVRAVTYTPNVGSVPDAVKAPLFKLLDFFYWAGVAVAGTAVMLAVASFLMAGDDAVKRDRAKKQLAYSLVAVVGIAFSFNLVDWILA